MNIISQKSDEIRLDFLAEVSQHLSTPLSITREGLGVLFERIQSKLTDPEKKIFLTTVRNIEKLSQILKNLTDISFLEAGKLEFKRKKINLLELLKQVQGSWELKVRAKGLAWKTNVPLREIFIYGHPDRIEQIFFQLLDNAIKFTKKGSVEISIIEQDKCAECSVSDTGVGIDSLDLPKLFKKFKTLSNADGNIKGLGLGLALVKSLVNMHQGKVWAKSKLGEGTSIHFTIPKSMGKVSN